MSVQTTQSVLLFCLISLIRVPRAYSRGGQTRRALDLLQVVKDKKLPLDGFFYNAMIDACAKGRLWKKGLELLDEMEEEGVEPNPIVYR